MDMMNEPGESGPESAVPPSQEGMPDFAQGYEITVCVYPDGFEVTGPNPLPQAKPETEDEERIPDLATALKHVVLIHKEHPVDSDLQSHFNAGYKDA